MEIWHLYFIIDILLNAYLIGVSILLVYMIGKEFPFGDPSLKRKSKL